MCIAVSLNIYSGLLSTATKYCLKSWISSMRNLFRCYEKFLLVNVDIAVFVDLYEFVSCEAIVDLSLESSHLVIPMISLITIFPPGLSILNASCRAFVYPSI